MTEEIIHKTFRPEVRAVNETEGIIDMLIPMSTDSIDREGESIDPLGWKKSLPAFRKRPVLVSSHDYHDLRKQIGEFVKIKVSEDGLFAQPKYYINEGNEEADWAFKLASKGMAAYSVGFIPKSWVDGDGEKEPKRTYTEQELLEISHVVVPSQRDAIQGIRGKSADPVINEVIDDVLKDSELIEQDGKYWHIVMPSYQEKTHTLIEHIIDDDRGIRSLYCVDCKEDVDFMFDKAKWTEEQANSWVKSKLVTKPEETANFIHIPVNQCPITATIDISKKEGISAKYCGKEKQIATYMFDKREPYNWTMERAKKWVADHEKSICAIATKYNADIDILVTKSAIPYSKTPLADEGATWDAGVEVKQATVDDLKIMCAIVEGDPENKTSYKLPHHRAGGDHACVWNGVRACAAVLMGARGGVDASEASIAGAKTHIAKHYEDFGKGEPPWNKGVMQVEIADEIDYIKSLLRHKGMNDDVKKEAWDLVREIMRLTGNEMPEDIRAIISPIVETKPEITNQDILEAIKRIAKN